MLRVSRDEAQAEPTARPRLGKLDTGNRGSVSRDEFDKCVAAMTRTSNPNSSNPKGTGTNPAPGAPSK
ncbi:MAG TPA: hypothetical protein VNE58_17065 [Casimicrobiaceae bacterium]|nr:hypothetical protein [Casimicrobiaceae bacterium]